MSLALGVKYYIGAKMIVYDDDGSSFEDVVMFVPYEEDFRKMTVWGDRCEDVPLSKVKLILKRIRNMNTAEKIAYKTYCTKEGNDTPLSFVWLIENKYDIFNLIRRKVAIDEKTLNKTT